MRFEHAASLAGACLTTGVGAWFSAQGAPAAPLEAAGPVVASMMTSIFVNSFSAKLQEKNNKVFAERNHLLRRGMAMALLEALQQRRQMQDLPADPYNELFQSWLSLLGQALSSNDMLESLFPVAFADSHWDAMMREDEPAAQPFHSVDLELESKDAEALAGLLRSHLTYDFGQASIALIRNRLLDRWSEADALQFAGSAMPLYRKAFAVDFTTGGLLKNACDLKTAKRLLARVEWQVRQDEARHAEVLGRFDKTENLLDKIHSILQGRSEESLPDPSATDLEVKDNLQLPTSVVNNVPPLWNETIGRRSEVDRVSEMLTTCRFVTITGAGGAGKTRLAIEVANRLNARFERGTLFVDLASLAAAKGEDSLVPSRIATVAGVREQVKRPPTEILAEHLRKGNFLLVLDNCEHVADSCAKTAAFLITVCPGLTIVATSRSPLHHPAERVFALGPLAIPGSTEDIQVGEAMESPAVQLFVKRVQWRSPEYALDALSASAVAEICRALDGLPLAIEVAVGSLDVASVEDMRRNSRTLVEFLGEIKLGDLRHWDSLTAALKWSCDLLGPEELAFMKVLSVFDGGWTAEAALGVYDSGGLEKHHVRGQLHKLHEHSLLFSIDWKDSKRFRFFEPIRQFIQSQIGPAEQKEYRRKHAQYFAKLLDGYREELLREKQIEVLELIQVEVDNVRACIRWAVENQDAETGLRLIASTWRFCEIRGYLNEGRERAHDVLGIHGTQDFPLLRSNVLSGAGMLAYRQGDFDAAEAMFEESYRLEVRLNRPAGVANALGDLAIVALERGDMVRVHALQTESLLIERKLGNDRQIAVLLNNMGAAAAANGRYAEAEAMLKESVMLFKSCHNLRDCAFALNHLAHVAVVNGDFASARLHAGESLSIRRERSDTKGIADTLRTLVRLQIETQQYVSAKEMLQESLRAARSVADRKGVAQSVSLFASLALQSGDALRAVLLYSSAGSEWQKLHLSATSHQNSWRARDLQTARAVLGDAEYDTVWEQGSGISLAKALELGAQVEPARPIQKSGQNQLCESVGIRSSITFDAGIGSDESSY